MTPRGVRGGGDDHRLRPSERLRQSAEYQRLFRDAVSYPGRLLVLFVLAVPDAPRRVGFVASRKVGNAVRRNRAKRLMREAYRHHKGVLPASGVHVVLVARHACGLAPYRDVERDFIALLTQAGFSADSPLQDSSAGNEATS